MKPGKLRRLIFFALCCDLGLFSKRLIAPAANIITDALHIPGGIGTSFSLMFLVVAAALLPRFGCGALMGVVQSAIALAMGMNGSMGALSPIGYIVPGFVIDCVFWVGRRLRLSESITSLFANMLAAGAACITANLIVFRLWGAPLILYLAVALTTGAICGFLSGELAGRLRPVIRLEGKTGKEGKKHEEQKDDSPHSGGAGIGDGDRGGGAPDGAGADPGGSDPGAGGRQPELCGSGEAEPCAGAGHRGERQGGDPGN